MYSKTINKYAKQYKNIVKFAIFYLLFINKFNKCILKYLHSIFSCLYKKNKLFTHALAGTDLFNL